MRPQPLTDQQLQDLAGIDADPVVSIYLPTAVKGADTRQGPVRMKNLVREAEQLLSQRGKPQEAAGRWLRPVAELIDDSSFWQHQGEGLAVFRWKDQLRTLGVPVAVDERVYVNGRPYLVPLLTPEARARSFALLALSLNDVRLLSCHDNRVDRLEAEGLPSDFASALERYIDTEKSVQYHSGASHARAAQPRAPIYHGQGAAGDQDTQQPHREEYLRLIDRAVRHGLHDTGLPLIVAADKAMAAMYQRINRYHPTIERPLHGNFDHLSDAQLRDKATPLIERRRDEARIDAVQRYRETPPDGTVAKLEEALLAAEDGRVAMMFLRAGAEAWGRVRPMDRRVETHEQRDRTDDELVNLAACRTLTARGEALTLQEDEMPCDAPLCAVLRY